MDCEKCRELLGEILIGPGSNDPAVLSGELEEHLASCYFCLEEREDLKTLREKLLPLKQSFQNSFPPVTDAQVEELKRKVRAKVRALEEGKEKKSFWIGRQSAFSFVACFAVVAFALLGSGIYLTISDGQTQTVQQHDPQPKVAARVEITGSEAVGIKSPEEALTQLQDNLRTSNSSDIGKVLVLAEEIRQKWPRSTQATAALEAMSKAYEQMGEPDRARAAYVEFADAEGALAKSKAIALGQSREDAERAAFLKTSGLLRLKALQLQAQQDFQCLPYYDILLSRYPETDVERIVRWKLSEYYESIGSLGESIAQMRKIAEKCQDEHHAKEAYRNLSRLALNEQNRDGAIQILVEFCARFPSVENKAFADLESGMILYLAGKASYPQALVRFQAALREAPVGKHAQTAKAMIEIIGNQVSVEMLIP